MRSIPTLCPLHNHQQMGHLSDRVRGNGDDKKSETQHPLIRIQWHDFVLARATSQAVSRRPLTAQTRIRSHASPCGIVVNKVAMGFGFFSEYCRFPFSSVPLLNPSSTESLNILRKRFRTNRSYISGNHVLYLQSNSETCLNRNLGITETCFSRETFTVPRIQISITCMKRNLSATEYIPVP